MNLKPQLLESNPKKSLRHRSGTSISIFDIFYVKSTCSANGTNLVKCLRNLKLRITEIKFPILSDF